MTVHRDVGIVLSGGGVNGVMMELGFLQRLRESELWPRIAVIVGTSSGALSGSMAALDRLPELEEFLMSLQPEQTFRPNRLWRLPFLGLHDYVLPQTLDAWFGGVATLAQQLVDAPVELVVVATDVTGDEVTEPAGFELTYSSWSTPPDVLAQAILASAAISALVLPLRVADRIATDGSWVRNYPLTYAYDHAEVELIVAFRYLPRYPRLGVAALEGLRRRLRRFARVPPVRAFLEEIEQAEARAARGEVAHLADMLVQLARVAVLRNTQLEERTATEKDQSLRELRALRDDVLALVDDEALRSALETRFNEARFPFRHDRFIPRFTVHGSIDGAGLDPGLRTQPRWSSHDKRLLIRRGWDAADAQLSTIDLPDG